MGCAGRQVAVERTRGNVPGAIEASRHYLEHFGNDKDAWEELAELYLEVCVCVCCCGEALRLVSGVLFWMYAYCHAMSKYCSWAGGAAVGGGGGALPRKTTM